MEIPKNTLAVLKAKPLKLKAISSKDIKLGKTYLIKFNDIFQLGYFDKQWHGLIFQNGMYHVQFVNDDGANSKCTGIWELPTTKNLQIEVIKSILSSAFDHEDED
jgi:hypothetical protein